MWNWEMKCPTLRHVHNINYLKYVELEGPSTWSSTEGTTFPALRQADGRKDKPNFSILVLHHVFTYHFQDFEETLTEEGNHNCHDGLIIQRHVRHDHPEDPVQGADGNASKVEDDRPLGAAFEAFHLAPRLWHLEPET